MWHDVDIVPYNYFGLLWGRFKVNRRVSSLFACFLEWTAIKVGAHEVLVQGGSISHRGSSNLELKTGYDT